MLKAELADVLERAAQAAITFRHDLADRPMRPAASYQEMLASGRQPTPESGRPPADVIDELVAWAAPGLHASAGPRFFGWVIGSSHPVGVAADWLTSAWGQNCGNHHAAPAGAEIGRAAWWERVEVSVVAG